MNERRRVKLVAALLEELGKHGIISAACRKVGLPKATYYRWLKEDKVFCAQADEALLFGRQEANDLARSRLLQKIDQGESWAIRSQLSRRDPDYRRPEYDLVADRHKLATDKMDRDFIMDVALMQEKRDMDLARVTIAAEAVAFRRTESQWRYGWHYAEKEDPPEET